MIVLGHRCMDGRAGHVGVPVTCAPTLCDVGVGQAWQRGYDCVMAVCTSGDRRKAIMLGVHVLPASSSVIGAYILCHKRSLQNGEGIILARTSRCGRSASALRVAIADGYYL